MYRIETQKLIIFSCCILHNYLRNIDPMDGLLEEVDAEILNQGDEQNEQPNIMENNEETRKGEQLRDSIVAHMWANYISNA